MSNQSDPLTFLSTKNGTTLPIEIVHNILQELQSSVKLKTLANLRSCSKSHYQSITPYLFRHVTVNSVQFAVLCRLVVELNEIPEEVHFLFTKFNANPVWNSSLAVRVRYSLSLIDHLTIYQKYYGYEDRPSRSMEYSDVQIIQIITKISEVHKHFMGFPLISNLRKLTVRVDTRSWGLLHLFEGLIHIINRPTHFCLTDLFSDQGKIQRNNVSAILEEYCYCNTVVYHDLSKENFSFSKLDSDQIRLSLGKDIFESMSENTAWYAILSAEMHCNLEDREWGKDRLMAALGRSPRYCKIFQIQSSTSLTEQEDFMKIKSEFEDWYAEDVADSWDEEKKKTIPEDLQCLDWISGEEALREPFCEACGSE